MTNTEGKPLTVAAVDNDRMALLALKGIMPQLLPESRWLWGVETAEDAVRKVLAPATRPDVLLVDMSLGEATGVSVCRRIRQRTDTVALLAITAFAVDTYAERVAAAGAQGIVSKADIPQLAQALRAVADGGVFVPAELKSMRAVADRSDADVPEPGPARSRQQRSFLTPAESHHLLVKEEDGQAARDAGKPRLGTKEAETLHLLAQGLSYDEIASRWGVAASTVRTHAHRAVDKLDAHSLAHAIAIWLSQN